MKTFATVLGLLAVASVARGNVVIDDFNTGNANLPVTTVGGSNFLLETGLNSTNTVGGSRASSVTFQSGAGSVGLFVNDVGVTGVPGMLETQSSSLATGNWSVTYDATFGGLNLDATSISSISVEVVASDVGGTVGLTLLSDLGGASASHSESQPLAGGPETLLFDLIDFANAGVDLADIDRIILALNGNQGQDTAIDEIRGNVRLVGTPEASSMLVWLVASVSVGAWFVRRS